MPLIPSLKIFKIFQIENVKNVQEGLQIAITELEKAKTDDEVAFHKTRVEGLKSRADEIMVILQVCVGFVNIKYIFI